MTLEFQITQTDIIHQVKLSRQMPVIIEDFLSRQIVLQQAEIHQIEIATEELQQAADTLRSKYELWTAESTWAWLQDHYLSIDQFEELAYINLLSTKLAQQLFEQPAQEFFQQHRSNYIQVVLHEVILSDQDLAWELFYALQENEVPFAEVAQQYNTDPELRQNCGYRGALRRTDLLSEIADRVFAARPPELLRPIVVRHQNYLNPSPLNQNHQHPNHQSQSHQSQSHQSQSHLIYVEAQLEPQFEPPISSEILSDFFSQWLKQQVDVAKQRLKFEL